MKLTGKMICFLTTILLLAQPCLGSAEDLEAIKESTMLAAELLVNELRDAAGNRPIDEGSLGQKMNANKEQHLLRVTSHALSRKPAQREIEEWFASQVQVILKRLDTNLPENVPSWFGENERKDLTQLPAKAIKENLDKHYKAAFTRARTKACENQWKRLTFDVYPAEDEFDSKTTDDLRQMLLDRILNKQMEAIFEENQSLTGEKIIDPVLADAARQKWGQQQVVQKSDGGIACIPDDIGDNIRSDLESYRKDLNEQKAGQKIARKVYVVFPSVETKVSERAVYLAADKFSDALSVMNFIAKKDEIKAIIKESPAKHSSKNNSRKACKDSRRAGIVKVSVEQYALKAPEARRERFQSFLESVAVRNSACQREIEGIVERSIDKNFGVARRELAKEQFEAIFAPLAAASWVPTLEEINKQFDNGRITIRNPLSMPGISLKTLDAKEILDETEELVLDAEKKLIGEGLGAVRKQMALIYPIETQLAAELKGMEELPSDEDLAKTFTERVKAKWPSNSKYPELFERVTTEIVKRAKALLPREKRRREKIEEDRMMEEAKRRAEDERRRREQEARDKAADGGGGEEEPEGETKPDGGGDGSGGGTGEGPGGGGVGEELEIKEFTPDVIVDLDHKGEGTISTTVYFVRLDRSTSFDFSFQATDSQLAGIRELFESWLKYGGKKDSKEFWVLARIFDRKVNYGAVYDFRKCLESAIKERKNGEIRVYWYDELFEDKSDKGTYNTPDDYKAKSMPLSASSTK